MTAPLLQACLNGGRRPGEHPRVPILADELAAEAAAAWMAGAHSVHVHPRDSDGRETLGPGMCGEAIAAIRAASPSVEVSLSTGAFIDPDVDARIACIHAWTVLPDAASVNFGDADCERILVEVPDADPQEAVAHAARIEAVLQEAMVMLPRLHHGEGRATWAVLVAAARAGHHIRIGLEDTLELPDGSVAASNEAMVRAASELQRRAARTASG